MAETPDYIDDDGQGWWERAGGVVRSDPTSRRYARVYLTEVGDMSPEGARRLGRALLAAADFAEPGGSES